MNFIKQEFFMIIAAVLLLLPLVMVIDQFSYEIGKVVVWVIFWFYMFRSYKIDKKWVALFILPVLVYNPIYPLRFTNEMWSMINGFMFVIAFSWLLKSYRHHI